MCFTAIAVANTLINLATERNIEDMTPMKLQKLLFFSHALYLKKYKKPLVRDDFLKWKYGPVVFDVYREFAGFKAKPVTALAINADGSFNVVPSEHQAMLIINAVLDIFGDKDPWTLSLLTHTEGTAWDKTKDGEIICNKVIESSDLYR